MDAEIGVLTSCRSLRVGYQFRFFFSFCNRKQDRICTKISTNHLTVSRLKRCTLYSLFKRRPLNTLCDILKFASTLKLLTLIPPAKTPHQLLSIVSKMPYYIIHFNCIDYRTIDRHIFIRFCRANFVAQQFYSTPSSFNDSKQ